MFIIGGIYGRQRLNSPKGAKTRPTAARLRESLFNICQHKIENARFLDIFAGSGAIGLEALSRGAQSTTFIEASREALSCIECNINALKVKGRTQILRGEAFAMLKFLEKRSENFDIIYADPPYQTSPAGSSLLYSEQIIQWVDSHSLLTPGGILFIEEDFRFQPHPHQLQSLKLIDSRRMGPSALQQYQRC